MGIKVSVCITTYNHAPYIAQAIESVLQQRCNFDYEMLIGDDDSNDGTRAIVEQYAANYPEVIRPFYHQTADKIFIRGRMTGRRNFANNLQQARGEYFILLDGDDYWSSPDKLQQQVDFLEQNPEFAAHFHNARCIDADGNDLGGNAVFLEQQRFTQTDLLIANPVPTMSCLMRNPGFSSLPAWFYQTDMGDWPVHLLVSAKGDYYFQDVNWAVYRIHAGGIWRAFREDSSKGMLSQILVWQLLLTDNAFAHAKTQLQSLIQTTYLRLARLAEKAKQWQVSLEMLEARRAFMHSADAIYWRRRIKLLCKHWLSK